MINYSDNPDEFEQLHRQDVARRQRQRQLLAHPDPRDPDHPRDDEDFEEEDQDD